MLTFIFPLGIKFRHQFVRVLFSTQNRKDICRAGCSVSFLHFRLLLNFQAFQLGFFKCRNVKYECQVSVFRSTWLLLKDHFLVFRPFDHNKWIQGHRTCTFCNISFSENIFINSAFIVDVFTGSKVFCELSRIKQIMADF